MHPSLSLISVLMGSADVKLDLQKRTITINQEPQLLDKYTSYLSRSSLAARHASLC
jgi:hypothetical protein